MKRENVENFLMKLKRYWLNKDVENAALLFKKTVFYQEMPFIVPYTTFEEIKLEWEHIKEQDIKEIEFKILAVEKQTAIVEWIFKRDIHEFNGVYEIKFNLDGECISFRSWEMEKQN